MQFSQLLIPNLAFNSLIALDVSGSRNLDPNYLFSLLQRFMSRQVIVFTTKVDGILSPEDLWTPESLKLALQKINVAGGTDVQPVVNYFTKNRFDHLVVITDGELALPTIEAHKITWVIDEVPRNQDHLRHLPGTVIIGV